MSAVGQAELQSQYLSLQAEVHTYFTQLDPLTWANADEGHSRVDRFVQNYRQLLQQCLQQADPDMQWRVNHDFKFLNANWELENVGVHLARLALRIRIHFEHQWHMTTTPVQGKPMEIVTVDVQPDGTRSIVEARYRIDLNIRELLMSLQHIQQEVMGYALTPKQQELWATRYKEKEQCLKNLEDLYCRPAVIQHCSHLYLKTPSGEQFLCDDETQLRGLEHKFCTMIEQKQCQIIGHNATQREQKRWRDQHREINAHLQQLTCLYQIWLEKIKGGNGRPLSLPELCAEWGKMQQEHLQVDESSKQGEAYQRKTVKLEMQCQQLIQISEAWDRESASQISMEITSICIEWGQQLKRLEWKLRDTSVTSEQIAAWELECSRIQQDLEYLRVNQEEWVMHKKQSEDDDVMLPEAGGIDTEALERRFDAYINSLQPNAQGAWNLGRDCFELYQHDRSRDYQKRRLEMIGPFININYRFDCLWESLKHAKDLQKIKNIEDSLGAIYVEMMNESFDEGLKTIWLQRWYAHCRDYDLLYKKMSNPPST